MSDEEINNVKDSLNEYFKLKEKFEEQLHINKQKIINNADLSKKEKRKRKVREDMAVMKNWEMHSKNYNKEMVIKLTGLNEAYADTFMMWFNSQNILPYTASEYQVRAAIVEQFQVFKLDYDLE